MSPSILNELFRIYFERYPMQAVTNKELGDTRGFLPELIADARWYKEKLIIERMKEALEEWLSSMEGAAELEALVKVMPKFEVIAALDSEMRDWATELAKFKAHPPQSPHDPVSMVFKPLLSDKYSITFYHSESFRSEEGTDNEGKDNEGSMLSETNGAASDSPALPPLPPTEQLPSKTVLPKVKLILGKDNGKAERGERLGHRKRVKAYHGEVETLKEQREQKAYGC
ncbi:hypothetical protein BT96DRAFT_943951 [Gymnopus androsaceus JB14]|uniref:Uncharacterized protein n=1 Tax=Gymnopus androsaceus JB14 TaxID=1447944 RepID=A0A6A4H6N9_9AGAR|nr:hypothetical protein BT96DRAFT_943951 [Gymnopus androsaceus JB14]